MHECERRLRHCDLVLERVCERARAAVERERGSERERERVGVCVFVCLCVCVCAGVCVCVYKALILDLGLLIFSFGVEDTRAGTYEKRCSMMLPDAL